MKRFITALFLSITLLCAIGLMFANFAPLVNPQEFWFFTLFGLAFPVLLIFNIYFLLHWLYYRKIYFIIPLLLLIFSFNNAKKLIAVNENIKADEKTTAFKILSYNVKNFEIVNVKSKLDVRKKIADFVVNENPDIMCFQEFYTKDNSKFENLKYFDENLNFDYNYFNSKFNFKKVHHFGVATYSKYPIIHQGQVIFQNSNYNSCIFTDVLIDGDTLRIYNTHFQSFKFKKDEYDLARDIAKNLNQISTIDQEKIDATKSVIKKLKTAYEKRSEQTSLVARHIKNAPYKSIIVGDFNDTPVSFTYQTFDDFMYDTFSKAATGFGGTYNGNLPPFRIDYIFSDKDLKVYDFKVLDAEFSDHFPISAELSF